MEAIKADPPAWVLNDKRKKRRRASVLAQQGSRCEPPLPRPRYTVISPSIPKICKCFPLVYRVAVPA
eukprot:634402-Rhodomonas_salina.2